MRTFRTGHRVIGAGIWAVLLERLTLSVRAHPGHWGGHPGEGPVPSLLTPDALMVGLLAVGALAGGRWLLSVRRTRPVARGNARGGVPSGHRISS